MGSSIETINISHPNMFINRDYISCAKKAASRCLKEHNGVSFPLGMIISTAIFRDNHVVEPALSSLILGELIKYPFIKHTKVSNQLNKVITFDLNNGACGLIQAIQLVDGYIQSGKIESGMIIAGDSINPKVTGLNISKGAAAIVLSRSNSGKGFIDFQNDTYYEYHDDSVSYSHFSNQKLHLTNEIAESFKDNAIECASLSFEKFLDRNKIKSTDIDLLVGSQHPKGFLTEFCTNYGLLDKMVIPDNNNKVYHTAAPLFTLHSVFSTNRIRSAKRILFITVGSGITTSFALYHQ